MKKGASQRQDGGVHPRAMLNIFRYCQQNFCRGQKLHRVPRLNTFHRPVHVCYTTHKKEPFVPNDGADCDFAGEYSES